MLRVRSILFLIVHAVAKSSAYPSGDTLTALIEQHKSEFSNSIIKESIKAIYLINERYPP